MAMEKPKKIKKKSFGRRKKPQSPGQSVPVPPAPKYGVPSIPSAASLSESNYPSPVRLNGPTKRPYSGLEPTRPNTLDGSPSTPKRSRSATWNNQAARNNLNSAIEIPEFSEPQPQPKPTPSPVRLSRFIEDRSAFEIIDSTDSLPRFDGSSDEASHVLKQNTNDTKDADNRKSTISATSSSGAQPQDSSFFRFGKSIASAFRPISVWSNLSSIWKQNQTLHNSPAKQNLGLHGASQATFRASGSTDQGDPDSPEGYAGSRSGNGDSNVDVGYQSTSSAISANAGKNPEPTYSSASSPAPSPQKTPVAKLIKTLRSKKSAPSLSTSASRSSLFLPTAFSNASAETFRTSVNVSPSKRHLRRQKKLTKKVSDLEDRLERAKRELDQVIVDAPPVPPIPDKYSVEPLPRVSTVAEFASELNNQLAMKRYSSMIADQSIIAVPPSASPSPSRSSITATSDNEEVIQTMISSLQQDDDPTPPRRQSPVARLELPRVLAELSAEKEHVKRKADSEDPVSPSADGPRPNKLRRSSPSSSSSDSSERESLTKIPTILKDGKSYIPVAVADPQKKAAPFTPRSIPVIVEDTEPYEWPEDVF